MKRFLLFLSLMLLTIPAIAQKSLEGFWVGTITNGIRSDIGYKFEMIIEVKDNVIKGRSFVHIGPDEIIEMELRGKMYHDRSVYMTDVEFIASEGKEVLPPFNRKYQFAYFRSIWDSKLEGYWQEIRPDAFNPKRQRGKIILKKLSNTKA